ncbi:pre-mRNA-splicing factor rse-1 [Fusarium coicis]|nr:pre-mRNA-splicing factor rse-1 [Fusarium coicis]
MATTSNMFLYSLSLRSSTAVSQAIVGHFSGTKKQQIIAVSGSVLSLCRPDPTEGRVNTLLAQDLFSIIRSVASFRLAGSSKDYIVVSSDSGSITVLEYLSSHNRLSRVLLETYGKSGVRRIVPGEYLAVDPRGRACMIASVEKNKLIYVLNRNAEAELTMSSPLEAHKDGVLVLSLVALEVGYSDPIFAALEADYSEADQDPSGQATPNVQLVYYELDLGLNHVNPLCVPIPRRRGATENPQRKLTIIGGVMHKLQNSPEAFFFLLQTEDGDIFKLTFDLQDSEASLTGEVRRIMIKYFDTIPVASSLCILKAVFLFVAAESGNHHLYQFEKLGDDDLEPAVTSDDFPSDPRAVYQPIYYYPRPIENLTLFQNIDSLSPLMDCKVADLTGEGVPQIYSVSGSGARSHFRMLKHGLEINEVAISELPGTVSGVWTTKLARHDKYDAYIILASSNNTFVMSVGDEVEQVSDSGFLTSVITLAVQQIGDDGLVQIHPKGIRHIRAGEINDWPVPQHRSIVAFATNERQVAVALSSGEIFYFEVDSDGSLADLGPVPEGTLRSPMLAVGCEDCTVRILSLIPDSTLESKSLQAVTAVPSALSIMAMEHPLCGSSGLYLHIGLSSGVYLRTRLDKVTCELSDTQKRFLGLRAIKLFEVTVRGQTCILALDSKPWLGYTNPTRGFMMTPLDCDEVEWACNFRSEQCEEGVIAIRANLLRYVLPSYTSSSLTIHNRAGSVFHYFANIIFGIFTIENLSDNMVTKSLPLTYTPRHCVKHPHEPYFYTIEADNNTLSPELRTHLLAAAESQSQGDAKLLPPQEFGYPRGHGRWASCISVVDPTGEQVLQKIELGGNEAATSTAVVPFTS